MRKVLLLLLLQASYLQAQTINGVVVNEKNEPVAFASISLLQANDSLFLTGTTTDIDGKFSMNGDYAGGLLKVSYVGYATQYIHPTQDLRIVMLEAGVSVGDVVITGSRPTYKMKGNALVAPIENTVLSKLGDASDVLAQLPLLNMKDGNVSVIGRGKTVVYINNRLMQDPQELQAIKSESIKDVKIDLNPGAQYSAEVGAVIRITTLRPVGEGWGGSLLAYYRHTNKDVFAGRFNLNYRHRDLDVYMSGIYNNGPMKQDQDDTYRFNYKGSSIYTTDQSVMGSDHYQTLNLTGGLNYSFSKNAIGGLRYNYRTNLGTKVYSKMNGTYQKDDAVSTYQSNLDKDYPREGNHQVNAFYQNEISEKWQLNADATYVNNKQTINGHQEELMGGVPTVVDNQSETKTQLWALKAWSTNQWLGGTAEWGFEATGTRSDQYYLMLNSEVAKYLPSTESVSNQKAQSLFLNFTRPLSTEWTATVGLRYEHVDFDYEINKQHSDEASRVYDNLFPSLSLTYSKNRTSLNLSYSTIVERPSYYMLRSEVQYNSSFSAEGGNPELQPTYTHNISLTFQHHDLILDASYNYMKNACLFYSYVLDEYPMSVATFMNHDMQTYNVNLIYSPTIGIWKPSFMIGGEGQVMHEGGTSYSGIGLNYQWKNILSLPKNWTIIFNLNGSSASRNQFSYIKALFETSFSVRKDIGKWQLTAGASDLFNTVRERWSMDTNGVYFNKWNNPHNQGVYLRAVYTFNPAKSKYKGGHAGQSELQRF
jgi:hypothetical protein